MDIIQHKSRPLPKIDELYNDVQLVSRQNELNRLLNCQPKPEWVREHPFAKGVHYIPIGIIEYLLTSIFVKWRVEVKDVKVIANSVQTTVRLHVQDPITGEWDWQDGIGAAPIQTEKGALATDFGKVLTDGVMKAAPSSESYAIKDAAEKFGKIFGKDMNRKDWLAYTSLDGKLDADKIQADADAYDRIRELLKTADMDHEDKDVLFEKLRGFVSVNEASNMEQWLQTRQPNPLVKVRNGHTASASEINQAVKQAANE